jgi:membrane protease YdiL (CAAX protease family)
LSPLSPPFTHRLNFDTSAAGLILFAFFCAPARSGEAWRAVARQTPIIVGTAAVVLLLGVAGGFVGVDVKLSHYTLVFFACNLLFTCITEEAFFRGFMQARLALAMKHWRAGPWIALLIAAVLFGLAHARGGPALIVLATIAGLGYGLAFLRSGRIEAAILAHITLNTLHFIAFTYPRAL